VEHTDSDNLTLFEESDSLKSFQLNHSEIGERLSRNSKTDSSEAAVLSGSRKDGMNKFNGGY
jgi:hypothetical protein